MPELAVLYKSSVCPDLSELLSPSVRGCGVEKGAGVGAAGAGAREHLSQLLNNSYLPLAYYGRHETSKYYYLPKF